MDEDTRDAASPTFGAAEIGALAHLYRGELYRSTVWRTRLDATTNWAVVSTGLALSLTFSSASASPLPLVLVSLLVAVFLHTEARRYRFFDFWRVRAHILETQFFGPILRGRVCRPATAGTKSCTRTMSGRGCTSPIRMRLGAVCAAITGGFSRFRPCPTLARWPSTQGHSHPSISYGHGRQLVRSPGRSCWSQGWSSTRAGWPSRA